MTPMQRAERARKIGYIGGVLKGLAALSGPPETPIRTALQYLDDLFHEWEEPCPEQE